jgi:hypothetical protein
MNKRCVEAASRHSLQSILKLEYIECQYNELRQKYPRNCRWYQLAARLDIKIFPK